MRGKRFSGLMHVRVSMSVEELWFEHLVQCWHRHVQQQAALPVLCWALLAGRDAPAQSVNMWGQQGIMHRHTPWLIRTNRIDHTLQGLNSWTLQEKKTLGRVELRTFPVSKQARQQFLLPHQYWHCFLSVTYKPPQPPLFLETYITEKKNQSLYVGNCCTLLPMRKFQPVVWLMAKNYRNHICGKSLGYIRDISGFI